MRADLEARRREQNDGGTVFKPTQFLAPCDGVIAGDLTGPPSALVQEQVQESQPDRGHQDRRHRHHGHGSPIGQAHPHHGALILAEQRLDPAQRDGVHVPGVARDGGDPLHRAAFGAVEAMVHVRSESQGDEAAILEIGSGLGTAEKIADRIRKPFRLEGLHALDRPEGADQTVAGAHQDAGIRIHRAYPRLQFPGEAFLEARKALVLRFAEVEVGEQAPQSDGDPCEQRVADAAQTSHRVGEQGSGNPVGQEEIQILLQQQAVPEGFPSVGGRSGVVHGIGFERSLHV